MSIVSMNRILAAGNATVREASATGLFLGLSGGFGVVGAALATPIAFGIFAGLTAAQLISTNVQFFTDEKKKFWSSAGGLLMLQNTALIAAGLGASAIAFGLFAGVTILGNAPVCFAIGFAVNAVKSFIDAGIKLKNGEVGAAKSFVLGGANLALCAAVVVGLICMPATVIGSIALGLGALVAGALTHHLGSEAKKTFKAASPNAASPTAESKDEITTPLLSQENSSPQTA